MFRKKWFRITALLIIVLIVLIGISKCAKNKKAAVDKTKTKVETAVVTRGQLVAKIEITGEVQPQKVINIKSKISGKVVRYYADENDFVRSGQIIADIEPDYNQANTLFQTKSTLELAEIRLKNAKTDYADKQKLYEKKYISEKENTAAIDELKSAEISYNQALEQYELIKDLDTGKKVVHVYATASGTVINRQINEGEMVISSNSSYSEGSVIMKIADLSKMIIKSNINEVDIAKFSVGQNAQIKIDALPYDEFTGQIVKISPMATTESNAKVFPVEISIIGAITKLKPGMSANISIIGESKNNVLLIPIRSVFTDDKSQDIVYKMKNDGTTITTVVKLGSNDLQNVEIVEGLREGDKVTLEEPAGSKKIEMNMQGM